MQLLKSRTAMELALLQVAMNLVSDPTEKAELTRFQQERFATVALPLYAIIDTDQRAIATFAGLTRDPQEFLRFLRSAGM